MTTPCGRSDVVHFSIFFFSDPCSESHQIHVRHSTLPVLYHLAYQTGLLLSHWPQMPSRCLLLPRCRPLPNPSRALRPPRQMLMGGPHIYPGSSTTVVTVTPIEQLLPQLHTWLPRPAEHKLHLRGCQVEIQHPPSCVVIDDPHSWLVTRADPRDSSQLIPQVLKICINLILWVSQNRRISCSFVPEPMTASPSCHARPHSPDHSSGSQRSPRARQAVSSSSGSKSSCRCQSFHGPIVFR